MDIPTTHFLYLSGILFSIGVIGAITRKNILQILFSVVIMVNAANINLAVFAHHYLAMRGQILILFIMAVEAAETAIGLSIVVLMNRHKKTLNVEDINLLKG